MRVVRHNIVVPVLNLTTTHVDVLYVFHNIDVIFENVCKGMQSDLLK